MSEKKSAKSLANSGQLLENTKSFSGCIVSGFSSVSLEKVPMLRFLLRSPTCKQTFQKFDICLLPSKDRVKLQAGYEGRKDRGRWEGREFFTVG